MAVARGRRKSPGRGGRGGLAPRLVPLVVTGTALALSVSSPALADPAPGRPAPGAGAPVELADSPEAASLTERTALPPDADLYVAAAEPLSEDVLAAVAALPEVAEVLAVDAARLVVDGRETAVVGVHLTDWGAEALSRPGGVLLTAAYAAEHRVFVGRPLPALGRQPLELDVAGFAGAALPGTDALVSAATADRLGLPSGNAALVSAPDADAYALRDTLLDLLPEGSGVSVLPMAGAPVEVVDAPPEAAPPPGGLAGLDGERIEAAIAAAESRLGLPYVWGGSGPNVFDCSGLVQWSFRQAGVELPRVTHEQWRTGVQLPYEQARRGDLIFWRTDPARPGYISHVAIYLGDGMMLEAPRSGDVVKVTDVRLDNLAGIIRILPAAS